MTTAKWLQTHLAKTVQGFEREHGRHLLGWSYFWIYNVIHRALFRAIEMTYKGLHFGKPQWDSALGQAWGRKLRILENNASSPCHEKGLSSRFPSLVSTRSDSGLVFIVWIGSFCWAGQLSATDWLCLSQQHKGWLVPVVHGCWAIKRSIPCGGVFLLHSCPFRPSKEIKYRKDLANLLRFFL